LPLIGKGGAANMASGGPRGHARFRANLKV
jgi:hypothetical protein